MASIDHDPSIPRFEQGVDDDDQFEDLKQANITKITDKMHEIFREFQQQNGITSGDVSPELDVLFTIDVEDLAITMTKIMNHQFKLNHP